MQNTLRAVLFDLDGTFIDTAQDLAEAMNAVRQERGDAPLPIAYLRPHTARGASSMIGASYGIDSSHVEFDGMKDRFLDLYERGLLNHTQLWPGMAPVVEALNARKIAWGIVTNKAMRFTFPIVSGLKLEPQVLVCGDSTPRRKPDPEPLLYAAAQLAIPAAHIAYVGDAKTDMQAARAAGMLAVGAGYSDFVEPDNRHQWGVDVWVNAPHELLALPFAS